MLVVLRVNRFLTTETRKCKLY